MASPSDGRALVAVGAAFFSFMAIVGALIDSQAWLPAGWFPGWARRALAWHVRTMNDVLFQPPEPWFKALTAVETLVQVPFCAVAPWALVRRERWMRPLLVAYGAHTATTAVPILGQLAMDGRLAPAERRRLLACYSPFLAIPAWLACQAAARPRLFRRGSPSVPASKRD